MKSAAHDPFGERVQPNLRARLSVLGGEFTVQSTDAALLHLAIDAFGGLSRHRLDSGSRRYTVGLVASKHRRTWFGKEPPRPMHWAGNGILCATVDASNFAIIDVAMSRALVCISSSMMRYRYHARCELIELAFITLASRAQRLVPLHAACIGANGFGVLLMGASGTGKSTLSLHAMADGLQLLSEDSAFVAPETLQVTGIPNYLHLQPQSLNFLQAGRLRERIEQSPVIWRRSGKRKFEVDLREIRGKTSVAPLKLAATAFLSRRPAGRQPPLRLLDRKDFLLRLRREQPYACFRENWREFERRIVTLPSYELRRTQHPDIAVRLLRDLLDSRNH